MLSLSVPLLQGWWRRDAILFSGNPAAWTLTCEAFFYLLHPFAAALLVRMQKRGALIAAGGVVLVALATRLEIVLQPGGWIAGLPWPVLHLNEFLLGMCIAWALRCGWRPRVPVPIAVSAVLGWFAVLTLLTTTRPASRWTLLVGDATQDAATVLFSTLIVATAVAELRGRVAFLSLRPLVALGEWSYAFYLVHATLLYIALTLLGPRTSGWANLGWAAVMLALATAVAASLHLGVDKPLEARLRRWQAARRESKARSEPAVVPEIVV